VNNDRFVLLPWVEVPNLGFVHEKVRDIRR
jgi:hypothetical protein